MIQVAEKVLTKRKLMYIIRYTPFKESYSSKGEISNGH